MVTQSEGTEFAQKDKKKGNADKKDETPKKVEYDKEKYKDLHVSGVESLDIPRRHAQ